LRDGRDVTLSISKEWEARAAQVNQRDFWRYLKWARQCWYEQPTLRARLLRSWFEFKNMRSLNPVKFLNKARWQGYPGWGPRFEGWQTDIANLSRTEFNALQWVKSVTRVQKDRAVIPGAQWLDVRYEDILINPEAELTRILVFLGLDTVKAKEMTAGIQQDNTRKWGAAFSQLEQKNLGIILHPTLDQLGYTTDISHAA
jgi:hypothetical protein